MAQFKNGDTVVRTFVSTNPFDSAKKGEKRVIDDENCSSRVFSVSFVGKDGMQEVILSSDYELYA